MFCISIPSCHFVLLRSQLWLRFFSCFQFSITNFTGRKYLSKYWDNAFMYLVRNVSSRAMLPDSTVQVVGQGGNRK